MQFTPALLRLVFVLASATSAANAAEIHFVTENYPPFNYLEDGQIKGMSMDQVKLIMKNAKISYSVEIMPWARALALAEIEKDFCVFTAVHNAERDRKFKWVEPLSRSRTLLVRKAGSHVAPGTLDEAKAFTIGTQRGDFTHDILKNYNFPKIDLATDLDLSLKKLMSGRIDLMPISEKYYEKLKRDGAEIESVLTFSESTYSIACNRGVPDTTISTMQQELNRLIADGTQQQISNANSIAADKSASR